MSAANAIVTVRFDAEREYEFIAETAAISAADAGAWLRNEYAALECEPRNPVGKILLLDVIIDVAKYGGAAHFAARDEWAQRYARCCAAALQRAAVVVDVAALTVG